MADTRPTIKKFTGVDFDVWEMSLRTLLTIHQVSHVLNKAPKMTIDEVDAWEKAMHSSRWTKSINIKSLKLKQWLKFWPF